MRRIDPFRSAVREAIHLLAIADQALGRDGVPPHLVLDEATLRKLLANSGVDERLAQEVLRAARRYQASTLDRRLRRPQCPSCGGRVIPVIGGMVLSDIGELSSYGLVEILGCLVSESDPTWQCTGCGRSDSPIETTGRTIVDEA